jgi:hypothetical protein
MVRRGKRLGFAIAPLLGIGAREQDRGLDRAAACGALRLLPRIQHAAQQRLGIRIAALCGPDLRQQRGGGDRNVLVLAERAVGALERLDGDRLGLLQPPAVEVQGAKIIGEVENVLAVRAGRLGTAGQPLAQRGFGLGRITRDAVIARQIAQRAQQHVGLLAGRAPRADQRVAQQRLRLGQIIALKVDDRDVVEEADGLRMVRPETAFADLQQAPEERLGQVEPAARRLQLGQLQCRHQRRLAVRSARAHGDVESGLEVSLGLVQPAQRPQAHAKFEMSVEQEELIVGGRFRRSQVLAGERLGGAGRRRGSALRAGRRAPQRHGRGRGEQSGAQATGVLLRLHVQDPPPGSAWTILPRPAFDNEAAATKARVGASGARGGWPHAVLEAAGLPLAGAAAGA